MAQLSTPDPDCHGLLSEMDPLGLMSQRMWMEPGSQGRPAHALQQQAIASAPFGTPTEIDLQNNSVCFSKYRLKVAIKTKSHGKSSSC